MQQKKKIILQVAAVLVIVAGACLLWPKSNPADRVTYDTTPARKTDILSSITATGTIEPVTKVEVGTQVSGIVSHIYVDYNSQVQAGQVIAELDKTNLTSELKSARANLASVESELAYQEANHARYKALYDKGLISANEYETARLSYRKAQQSCTTSRENVKRAETNLGYATITSPISGVVLSKAVEEGQTVAASFNTPTLFTIAKDLTDMRVIADIDEADIGNVAEGQRVSFTVDAYPDDVFEGRVTQVRQEAATESNVVTYEVVISASNEDLKLKPGLTANVTVFTQEKRDVLAVPAKALRFAPNETLLREDESIADCPSPTKVWVRDGKVFRAIAVQTGTTNGTLAEITSGLQPGTEVLTDFHVAVEAAPAGPQAGSNPFMPGPPNRNKSNQKK